MKKNYLTTRLILNELSLNDEQFIMELVNTPEWIKFIGDRNIRTQEDARVYIQKIIDNSAVNYWIVKLQEQNIPIGIITFIKRDYLEHYDIGFAFLSKFTKKGYAYEATTTVLNDIINDLTHTHILATTVQENIDSIKLLEKLGFRFEKEIEDGNDLLLVYSISVDKLLINQVTHNFFNLFTNASQQKPILEKIQNICLPETIIIKKSKDKEDILNINAFIEPRKKILSDGTLTEFEEYEIFEETRVVANIAQRFSKYQKKGYLNGNYFEEKAINYFSISRQTKVGK
ncbi:MAG: GNAT family N-acetyltransferase [Ignavibacteriales bacterium]|nr:GNAT family N-acetyltransferase [Ignavibacteriales bacterium]